MKQELWAKPYVWSVGLIALVCIVFFSFGLPLWLSRTTTVTSPTASSPVGMSLPAGYSRSNEVVIDSVTEAIGQLQLSRSLIESRRILKELKARFDSLPAQQAADGIAHVLSSESIDAPTGISYSISKGGRLSGHPTIRVALLDWLGQYDEEIGGEISRQILAKQTHPDEWSIALRNLAWSDTSLEMRDLILEKTIELLNIPEWSAEPSIGFLEAFDVFVFAEASEYTDLLCGLVIDTSENARAQAYAAYTALDRLLMIDTASMLEQLLANPELLSTRPAMVANMVARADLRMPEERALVRDYVLSQDRSAVELRAFTEVFPNANFSISYNLLSGNTHLEQDEIRDRDLVSLGVVQEWIVDPRFSGILPYLERIEKRLVQFTQ